MDRETFDAIFRELDRIGISKEDLLGLAIHGDSEASFLEHLRALPPGASLHEVFPDMPKHWVAGKPETWTTPYRPYGPFDYQEPPTGAAIVVSWPKDTDRACLDELLSRAREAGFVIHGAGFRESINPEWPTLNATIVLDRDTSEDRRDEFADWIEAQPDVTLDGIWRRGDEEYC